jgi:UDP-4-amino-4,6-dideoxy-N-acetyl-beta-L-altrosamine N-acetyltransferase
VSADTLTHTVRLRPLRAEDSPLLHTWRNLPDVARFMYSDHVISAEEHAKWFAAIADDHRRQYWLIEMDGAPVGLANLYDIDPAHRRCGWAYYLAEPSTRGRGIGTYVEYFVLGHVFEKMGLNKLYCEVLASNEAVWSFHEKVGFKREALYRAHVFKNGAFEDVIGLAMRAHEWRMHKEALRQRVIDKGFSPPRSLRAE